MFDIPSSKQFARCNTVLLISQVHQGRMMGRQHISLDEEENEEFVKLDIVMVRRNYLLRRN